MFNEGHLQDFARLLGPMARRVRLMVSRCVISRVNNSALLQTLQVRLLSGEVRDGVEHFQPYGFAATNFGTSEGVYLSIGGDRDHGIVICAADRRYRIQGLQDGEVAIYTDLDAGGDGQHICLRRNGDIEVKGKRLLVQASDSARFETPRLECTGEIIDRCDAGGKTMKSMRDVHDEHDHPSPEGGSTGMANQKMN